MKKKMTSVGLSIIGDEILSGRRLDKHFNHAVEYFNSIGVDIGWTYYVGDSEQKLVTHFKQIQESGDICFSFGGIGATPDDLTRQAMAASHGVKLVKHPAAVQLIEEKFGETAYPNRIRMAELPEGSQLIPNDFNNIPGFSMNRIFCLPGFPEMAWPMMEWVVEHYFVTQQGPRKYFLSLIVQGAKESELIALLESTQKRFLKVKISSLPHFPRQDNWLVELGVRGEKNIVVDAAEVIAAGVTGLGFSFTKGPLT